MFVLMGLGTSELRYLALMALEDIADECDAAPRGRPAHLRFLLAWAFRESGADPAKRWIFDQFWRNATGPVGLDYFGPYCRSRDLQGSLDGIARELGFNRTPAFENEMKRRRDQLRAGSVTQAES